MRLQKRSAIRKARCWLRFCFAKIIKARSLMGSWHGFIDSGCCLYTANSGSIVVNSNFVVQRQCELFSGGNLSFGKNVFLNCNCRIICKEEIVIDDNVLMAPSVTVIDHDHARDETTRMMTSSFITKPIRIKAGVWLGEKSTVLKGVTIGEHAIIGAHSLVTKDVPPYAIAAGVPARVIS